MVSSGESARAHCGQTHGCCSTLTLDSKPVASARDVGKRREIAGKRTLALSRREQVAMEKRHCRELNRILVPKRDFGEALGRLPGV